MAATAALLGVPLAAQVRVKAEQKISASEGGFGGALESFDYFGTAIAALGDLDGDGTPEIAVGADQYQFQDNDEGAVWILSLNPDGTVASEREISATAGGFGGVLAAEDSFGSSVAALGDLDGDGTTDLAVGAPRDDDGGAEDSGAVWILFLNPDGTVASEKKISQTQGGFGGTLDDFDSFGFSVAALGDLDGDGTADLAVGAPHDDGAIGGAISLGAVWILFLNPDGTVAAQQEISETQGGFGGTLDSFDFFGVDVAALGDLDGDGKADLAVGASQDDDGGTNQGAVWILFLNSDGTVASEQKISATTGGFGGLLEPGDDFGISVAALGDLDGNGTTELAVGAFGGDNGQGALWILFLDSDGTVSGAIPERKISETSGGFGGALDPDDNFGNAVAGLGDLDGDGIGDLAVGGRRDDDGDSDSGAFWILFLKEKTTIRRFTGPLGSVTVTYPVRADPGAVPGARPADGGLLDGEQELDLTHPPSSNGGVALRNGSGRNEACFTSSVAARGGEEWQAWVDLSSHPMARASLVWVARAGVAGRPSPHGELLLDVRGLLIRSRVASLGGTHVHRFAIPPELAGHTFSLQACILDERGPSLTNAIDVTVGP